MLLNLRMGRWAGGVLSLMISWLGNTKLMREQVR
jgi:hypothetical protein